VEGRGHATDGVWVMRKKEDHMDHRGEVNG
jgi:hypothetical protein